MRNFLHSSDCTATLQAPLCHVIRLEFTAIMVVLGLHGELNLFRVSRSMGLTRFERASWSLSFVQKAVFDLHKSFLDFIWKLFWWTNEDLAAWG